MRKEYKAIKKIIAKLRKIKHLHICEEVNLGFWLKSESTILTIYSFTNIFDYDSYTKLYKVAFSSLDNERILKINLDNLKAIYNAEKKKKGRLKNVRRNY